MTEMAAAAAAKAGMQAARLVQGAASPYVVVKHGQREDRAAAYDPVHRGLRADLSQW
ncbi:hypothetical protein [Streptomyces sp. NPDC002187]|uniref:hypothetical protein n=1 Tax=Streptomyces sp. NPDC002187 TaxID=3364637 RepID=UPI0036895EE9